MIAQSRNYSNNQEDILLRSAIEGDREALGQLIAHYMPQLYRTALRLLKNPADAEDALQDSLLAAFRSMGDFQGRSKLSSWLTRIVINSSLMQLRRRSCLVMTSIDEQPNCDMPSLASRIVDPGKDPEDICAQREQLRILSGALGRLPTKNREALLLRDYQGMSSQEAAETQKISRGCLKTRLHRARRRLRKEISKPLPVGKTFEGPKLILN